MKTLLIMFLFLLLSCGKEESKPKMEVSRDTLISDEYLKLVNDHRQNRGLPILQAAVEIEGVSRDHSQKMAQNLRPFGHLGMSERCQRIKQLMRGGNLCGEIVARGQNTAEEVFKAWMSSPSHRKTIETRDYTHTGLGFVKSESGVIYWTQLFLSI